MKLHPSHWFRAEDNGLCAGCGLHWIRDYAQVKRACRAPHPGLAEARAALLAASTTTEGRN
jgi:hypothetical protein